MYTGKRKGHIRRRDLQPVDATYDWTQPLHIGGMKIALVRADGSVIGEIEDSVDVQGLGGDSLEVTLMLTMVDKNGEHIVDNKPAMLLPIHDRAYYWVEEDLP